MLRQVGLEDTVRAASLKTYHPTGGIVAVESLAGRELATYVKELNEGVEGFSNTVRVFINQDVLEPILREKAVELGARVINRTEVTGLDEDADGVTATLTRPRQRERAAGSRPLRRRRRRQPEPHPPRPEHRDGGLRRALAQHHDLLQGRLRAAAGEPQPGRLYVHNPKLRGFFRLDRTGGTGFLVINSVGEDVTRPEAINVSEGLTDERVQGFLSTAIGTDRDPRGGPACRALARRVQRRGPHAGRPRLPGRRRRTRGPAQRRLRRQHRRAGRAQPRLEARGGRQAARRGRSCSTPTTPSGGRSCRLTVDQAYTRYATRVVPERGTEDAKPFVDDLDDGDRPE